MSLWNLCRFVGHLGPLHIFPKFGETLHNNINIKLRKYSTELRKISSALHIMASSKTIKAYGYGYNAEGKLRKLDKNGHPGEETFQFNVSDNHQECQKNYEALGDAVTEYIYELLEKQENLIKLPVPNDSKEGTFIFASKDYHKKDQLIILIHGSGVVRAGQWARSLLINDSIKTGSQIPYIQKAISRGYGVIVLNTNDNYTNDNNQKPNSGNPEEHAINVWKTYISKTNASSIAIVAHSYGGVVTLALADGVKDFEKRVKAIAFTDSVHSFSSTKVSKYMKQIAKNWVSSNESLDTPVKTPQNDITMVSAGLRNRRRSLMHEKGRRPLQPLASTLMTAGHSKHEMTSYSCMESVFRFIDDKFSKP